MAFATLIIPAPRRVSSELQGAPEISLTSALKNDSLVSRAADGSRDPGSSGGEKGSDFEGAEVL